MHNLQHLLQAGAKPAPPKLLLLRKHAPHPTTKQEKLPASYGVYRVMRFTRKHHQQNIVKDDKFTNRKEDKEILEPEIFENVMQFCINTPTFQLVVREGDKYGIEEIVETANYFTFVSKGGRAHNCIKYDEVINFEFEL